MHQIRFVDDDALPEGHDFVLLTSDRGALLLYRSGAITPGTLEDSWAAYRATASSSPRPPARRCVRRKVTWLDEAGRAS